MRFELRNLPDPQPPFVKARAPADQLLQQRIRQTGTTASDHSPNTTSHSTNLSGYIGKQHPPISNINFLTHVFLQTSQVGLCAVLVQRKSPLYQPLSKWWEEGSWFHFRRRPHHGTSVGPNLQTHGLNMTPESHVSSRDYPFPQLIQPTVTGVSMSAKSADSAPPSPADRLTPRSAEQSVKADDDDEEMVDSGGEDEDDALDKVNMTPAEIRAQKRKMKRHRLTHTQTRFLVSEFARQAHPDAAHRDRLAREIPGLSSRQVQVWFQNRRAKLKRCSTADRDRIMRSRALPADFDNTKALRSQYGASPSSMSASTPAASGGPTFADHTSARSLALETTQRMSEYDGRGHAYASPTGVSPALGSFAFTPPAAGNISPDSGEVLSPYILQHPNVQDTSRRHGIGMPPASHGYPHQSASYQLPYEERLVRHAADVTSTPLRSSVSHTGLRTTSGSIHTLPERSSSFPEHDSQERSGFYAHGNLVTPAASEQEPFGLGFSYYQQSERLQQQPTVDFDVLRRTSSLGSMYQPFATAAYTPSPYGQHAPHQLSSTLPSEYRSHLTNAGPIEHAIASHTSREYQPSSASRPPHFATGDDFNSSFQLRTDMNDTILPPTY
ncbi:unnamed protein product [Zymoseptoria tritici ST99CH_3D7]|uniref:Homeobox domain-containing protein n=2 Tax=Zymoseptoria tritici TaxID=1047171 RepID=A0A1X7RNI7_ZYMT9|nr:unnamed protein product [Zymoseptoria tritici ST99CH_3D7]